MGCNMLPSSPMLIGIGLTDQQDIVSSPKIWTANVASEEVCAEHNTGNMTRNSMLDMNSWIRIAWLWKTALQWVPETSEAYSSCAESSEARSLTYVQSLPQLVCVLIRYMYQMVTKTTAIHYVLAFSSTKARSLPQIALSELFLALFAQAKQQHCSSLRLQLPALKHHPRWKRKRISSMFRMVDEVASRIE